MFDVVALGEVLIDFTPNGKGTMGNPAFEMNPGGAPANCLAAVNAFGGKTAFIGKVGKDNFGDFLKKKLSGAGIDIKGVMTSNDVHTTLAFVHLDETGDRSFDFFRDPGADIMLTEDEINFELIDNCKIFHFGSLSLTHEPVRAATFAAVNYAKQKGKIISYDPNYRPLLWKDREHAKKYMGMGLELADIVKMSEEEMELLTGHEVHDYENGAKAILASGKQAVFITLGKAGAFYATKESCGKVDTFLEVKTVDTTGCGDSFTGALLYAMNNLPKLSMEEMVRLGCATGSLCSSKMGGFPAMPSLNDACELAFQKKSDEL